jgi:hypothetical protein
MLFFTRPILVFCGVAIALGIGADALFFTFTMLAGGGGLLLRRGGWFVVFGTLWLLAFVIGSLLVRKLGLSLFR